MPSLCCHCCCLAFVCHHNTYIIYASLSNHSLKRFSIVSHVSVFTSFIFCAVLGLSGFLSFQEQTQGEEEIASLVPSLSDAL